MKLHIHDTDFNSDTTFLMMRPEALAKIKTEGKAIRISWAPMGEPRDKLSIFAVNGLDEGFKFGKPEPFLILEPRKEPRELKFVGNGSNWTLAFAEID